MKIQLSNETGDIRMSEIKGDYLGLKSLSIKNRDFCVRAIIDNYFLKVAILYCFKVNVEDWFEFCYKVISSYYLFHCLSVYKIIIKHLERNLNKRISPNGKFISFDAYSFPIIHLFLIIHVFQHPKNSKVDLYERFLKSLAHIIEVSSSLKIQFWLSKLKFECYSY